VGKQVEKNYNSRTSKKFTGFFVKFIKIDVYIGSYQEYNAQSVGKQIEETSGARQKLQDFLSEM
jgi:hypothetical protein